MCQRGGVSNPALSPGERVLRVALDATPLLDARSGVGEFCRRALQALSQRDDLAVEAYAVSWRRRHGLRSEVPPGVTVLDRPMPARPLHKSWSVWPLPPIELFIGRVDVVHGTNFVVPPARRAATVVTVHDLTPVYFPELVERATLAYPGLIRKALRRGAWVHTPSEFVAREVVEVFGAPPERVRAVHHGIVPPAPHSPGSADGLALLPGWVRRYVLAVGTVEPRKDLPTLVRAFGSMATGHPDLALVIAGRDGWGQAQLEEAVAASPARDQVVRLGRIEDIARDALGGGGDRPRLPVAVRGLRLSPVGSDGGRHPGGHHPVRRPARGIGRGRLLRRHR